ncbi:MAG: 50S ribosomal protein L19 [Candidatus Margulisiibacteriota bacterium]
MASIIGDIEAAQLKEKFPDFKVGDTVRVYAKIIEGDKERLQGFEGVVIARKGGSSRETFTVRKVVQGVGVERIFPIHSPKVDRIKILKQGKIRRAKLYYLRSRVGSRATKIQDKAVQSTSEQPAVATVQ